MGLYKFPGASSHLEFEDILELLSFSALAAIVTAESATAPLFKSFDRSSRSQ